MLHPSCPRLADVFPDWDLFFFVIFGRWIDDGNVSSLVEHPRHGLTGQWGKIHNVVL
jgi:hypothetical protein